MSVVAEIEPLLVPELLEKATVKPPTVAVFPAASLAVSVSVDVLPLVIDALATLMSDCEREIVPTCTETCGDVVVTGVPPIVALMLVAVPAIAPVNEARYVPLLSSVVVPMVPVEDPPLYENTTVAPPIETTLLLTSRAFKRNSVALPDATEELLTDNIDVVTEIGPGTTVIVGRVLVTGEPLIVALTVEAEPAVEPVKVAE